LKWVKGVIRAGLAGKDFDNYNICKQPITSREASKSMEEVLKEFLINNSLSTINNVCYDDEGNMRKLEDIMDDLNEREEEKKMLKINLDQVMKWSLCEEYPREEMEKLFQNRENITVIEILNMNVPNQDKLLAVLREEILSSKILHKFAYETSYRILLMEKNKNIEIPSECWEGIEIKKQWIDNKIESSQLEEKQLIIEKIVQKIENIPTKVAVESVFLALISSPRKAALSASSKASTYLTITEGISWEEAQLIQINLLKEIIEKENYE
jgi:hypothetical protein